MEFIFGEESYFIAKKIKEIKDSFNGEIILLDDESSLEQIYNEIFTHSIFEQNKLIILRNIDALTSNTEASIFMKMFKTTPQKGVKIIFIFDGMPNEKNSLVKFLIDNSKISQMDKITENEIASTIKQIVRSKGGEIKYSTAINLSLKLPNNLRLIIREIDKLINESKEITDKMIEDSIGYYGNENIFELSNAINTGNINEILTAYKSRIIEGEDPLNIISQISFVYNLVYNVKTLEKLGFSQSKIASKLNIHPFRIKKALEIYFNSSEKKINQMINNLASLEKNIKTGLVDPKIGLDNLILNIFR